MKMDCGEISKNSKRQEAIKKWRWTKSRLVCVLLMWMTSGAFFFFSITTNNKNGFLGIISFIIFVGLLLPLIIGIVVLDEEKPLY